MNTTELANWEELGKTSNTSTIEILMLVECERLFKKNPKSAIPTRYFKDNFTTIFGRKSTNPQPRLNKAMRALSFNELVELKKVAGKNYIRYIDSPTNKKE